jgi:hypothetical protein
MKITVENVSKSKGTIVLLGRSLAFRQTMEIDQDLVANPAIGRLISSGLLTARKPSAVKTAAPAPQVAETPKDEPQDESKDEGKRKGKKNRKSE